MIPRAEIVQFFAGPRCIPVAHDCTTESASRTALGACITDVYIENLLFSLCIFFFLLTSPTLPGRKHMMPRSAVVLFFAGPDAYQLNMTVSQNKLSKLCFFRA